MVDFRTRMILEMLPAVLYSKTMNQKHFYGSIFGILFCTGVQHLTSSSIVAPIGDLSGSKNDCRDIYELFLIGIKTDIDI